MAKSLGIQHYQMSLGLKFRRINWSLVLVLTMTAMIGIAMLYSAANGNLDPWASRHAARFGAGLVMMIGIALIDIRHLLRWAYGIYGLALAMLALVEIMGISGMGAQRWIDLGFFQLQPSEVMKMALVLALARYFHGLTMEETRRLRALAALLLLVLAPAALVLRQPDLGTAVMLMLTSAAILLAAGVRLRIFAIVAVAGLSAIPLAWQFLRDYQKERILTFLDPERDPLGAGYQILQSKIALGSGGMFGKGFLNGTQSQLSFLPERQTDFIFTMLAEEFGLMGGLTLLALYTLILIYGFVIGLGTKSQFARLVATGVTATFFVYVFINIAMVTIMVGVGLLMSVYVHRDIEIPRRPPV